jgi:hypothetical protein
MKVYIVLAIAFVFTCSLASAFNISVPLNSALITGGIAGALGGLLGAFCLVGITQIVFKRFRQC